MALPLKQSTNSQEIPLGYFLDDTDGDTEETGLTIANTDIKLWKNGATTLANKNSGGATHISNGIYYITLDSTDTNTVGPMVVFCHVSGALATRMECVVYEENIYDQFFGSGADGFNTVITAVQTAETNVLTAVQTVDSVADAILTAVNTVDNIVDRIDTNVISANSTLGSGVALTAAAVDSIWDEVIETSGSDNETARQIMNLALAVLGGDSTGGGTTTISYKRGNASTLAITATVDASGNRTVTAKNL